MRILYIEDRKDSRELMKAMLSKNGEFKVETSASVHDAIKKLNNKSYDMILLDIMFPESSGYEIALYIRSELNLNTPIIAVSAIKEEYKPGTKLVGINDFIQKPIDFENLKRKIANFQPVAQKVY